MLDEAAMYKFCRAISWSFVILAIGGIAYYCYGFSTAESRLKEVCNLIKPGMSIAQLRDFGVEHGLAPKPHNESGVNFIKETRTYGRYGCKVILEAGIVKSAEYNFAD